MVIARTHVFLSDYYSSEYCSLSFPEIEWCASLIFTKHTELSLSDILYLKGTHNSFSSGVQTSTCTYKKIAFVRAWQGFYTPSECCMRAKMKCYRKHQSSSTAVGKVSVGAMLTSCVGANQSYYFNHVTFWSDWLCEIMIESQESITALQCRLLRCRAEKHRGWMVENNISLPSHNT